MPGLALGAGDGKLVVALSGEREFDEPRLGCSHQHGDLSAGSAGGEIFHDCCDHAGAAKVGRQLHVVGVYVVLAVFTFGANCHFALGRVDRHIHGMFKERTLLNMVIADELERAVLREDSGFVVE